MMYKDKFLDKKCEALLKEFVALGDNMITATKENCNCDASDIKELICRGYLESGDSSGGRTTDNNWEFRILVTNSGKNYWEWKNMELKKRRDEMAKFWIPVVISFIALINTYFLR